MPSTKRKIAHRRRLPKSADRAEEIELATVYLELKSRLAPTWGRCVEPDAYVTDLDGDILLAGGDADDEICVGTISAHSVHLDEANEHGVPWFRCSGRTQRGYRDYSDWVESAFEPFGSDLLILDRIRIQPEHRGHGYGLYAAQLMITGFASGGIVACLPSPYELLKNAPPLALGDEDTPSRRERSIPGWTAAQAKLRAYWSLLGFEQIPGSEVFGLSLTARRPSMAVIVQNYFASKRRRAPKARANA
jgi:hypothetical protein